MGAQDAVTISPAQQVFAATWVRLRRQYVCSGSQIQAIATLVDPHLQQDRKQASRGHRLIQFNTNDMRFSPSNSTKKSCHQSS